MNFTGAMQEVRNGGKIRREIWPDFRTFVSIQGDKLVIKNGINAQKNTEDEDNLFHPWIICKEELDAKDWEVVPGTPDLDVEEGND